MIPEKRFINSLIWLRRQRLIEALAYRSVALSTCHFGYRDWLV